MEEIKAQLYHYSLTCPFKIRPATPPEKYLKLLYLLILGYIV